MKINRKTFLRILLLCLGLRLLPGLWMWGVRQALPLAVLPGNALYLGFTPETNPWLGLLFFSAQFALWGLVR